MEYEKTINLIYNNLESLASNSAKIKIVSLCGGTPIKPQIEALTNQPQIIIATPGRLVDLVKREAINLKSQEVAGLLDNDRIAWTGEQGADEIQRLRVSAAQEQAFGRYRCVVTVAQK